MIPKVALLLPYLLVVQDRAALDMMIYRVKAASTVLIRPSSRKVG